MKVVGIDKIKLFRNFVFQKSAVIFTGYQHLRRLFFSDFEMSYSSHSTIVRVRGMGVDDEVVAAAAVLPHELCTYNRWY